jgi:hypothetical protein
VVVEGERKIWVDHNNIAEIRKCRVGLVAARHVRVFMELEGVFYGEGTNVPISCIGDAEGSSKRTGKGRGYGGFKVGRRIHG